MADGYCHSRDPLSQCDSLIGPLMHSRRGFAVFFASSLGSICIEAQNIASPARYLIPPGQWNCWRVDLRTSRSKRIGGSDCSGGKGSFLPYSSLSDIIFSAILPGGRQGRLESADRRLVADRDTFGDKGWFHRKTMVSPRHAMTAAQFRRVRRTPSCSPLDDVIAVCQTGHGEDSVGSSPNSGGRKCAGGREEKGLSTRAIAVTVFGCVAFVSVTPTVVCPSASSCSWV
jgi:hypothetical protein